MTNSKQGKKRDDVLRRMLETAPKPQDAPKKKRKKRKDK